MIPEGHSLPLKCGRVDYIRGGLRPLIFFCVVTIFPSGSKHTHLFILILCFSLRLVRKKKERSALLQLSVTMAAEEGLEGTQKEGSITQIQEDEEPLKTVNQKDAEIENVKDENKDEVREHDQHKTNEIVEVEGDKNVAEIEKEESNISSEGKHYEKKALLALRSKIEAAILENFVFKEKKQEQKDVSLTKDGKEEAKALESEQVEGATVTKLIDEGGKENELSTANERKEDENRVELEGENKETEEAGEKKEIKQEVMEEKRVDVDRDISLWGVPLLPSKGDERTDVILLKFLKARDFIVSDAFAMLRHTLQWRKDNNIDSILDEDFDSEFSTAAYMEGKDREGRPVCYNIFGVLNDDQLYNKVLGNEEKREKFLRWRIQLMEKGIEKLDFKPGGISTILQINDLKLTPGPMKKELRQTTSKAVELLQDNYPEFVAKNIFINVPFWYYAFSTLLTPFLTQITKDKFVYARASKVTDALLKYISGEEIPLQYSGLKRENDPEFSVEDHAKEAIMKPGSTEIIEIPSEEVGNTLVWDLSVPGWEVDYKEEFVPTDEKSYTLIVQKGRKMSWQERTVRNSFTNKEPGKLVITIENGSFKKKQVIYRHKTKRPASSA